MPFGWAFSRGFKAGSRQIAASLGESSSGAVWRVCKANDVDSLHGSVNDIDQKYPVQRYEDCKARGPLATIIESKYI